MSKLSEKDVAHVAKLSSLSLTEQEIERFREQLSKIVEHVEELNEVDTKDVDPTAQTTGLVNKTRPDQPKPEDCLSQKGALSGTEKTHNGYFVIPMILKERSV